MTATKKQVATIIESACIGCTKCIDACPFDAIIGATKQMHVVLTEYCTGCQLCLPPCPVSCIELTPSIDEKSADSAKQRRHARKARLAKNAQEKERADKLAATVDFKSALEDCLTRALEKKQKFPSYIGHEPNE